MSTLKGLVHEVHRRSLWQVLGIYLAGSWVALQVVDVVTETAGLPDWTPGMAFVLLLLLLPVVLATAFVQEGMPGAREATALAAEAAGQSSPSEVTPDGLHHRVFRWRTVMLGALGAFTLLGLSIFAYFVMWSSGIGPVGNLQAQGVITEGAPVVLAELENRTDDPNLGAVLTTALRADLAQSEAFELYSGAAMERALALMGKEPSDPVTVPVAREISVRWGLAATIEGEVGSVGSSFVLTARIVATASGAEVASFRETAADASDLLVALNKLSREIRGRLGETLRAINATLPLNNVTTPSLEALRKYTEAIYQYTRKVNPERGIALVEEAVALDTAFAMGYRVLSAWYNNQGRTADSRSAAEAAYRHRDRLSRVERDLVQAAYLERVVGDRAGAEAVYRGILEYDPLNGVTSINLPNLLRNTGRYAEAIAIRTAYVEVNPNAGTLQYGNLVADQLSIGDVEGAGKTLERAVGPGGLPSSWAFGPRARIAARSGALEAAHAWADSLRASGGNAWDALYWESWADVRVGRMKEAAEHLAERAEVRARRGNHVSASGSRVYRAWTVLQTDTAEALRLLKSVEADALRAGPDSVYFGTLAWGYLEAGARDAVLRVVAASRGRSGAGLTEVDAKYLRFLGAVARSEDDEPGYEEYDAECVACARHEHAEMAYAAGRLQEAAAIYEDLIAVPGRFDWDAVAEPLYHERVAAIYEELGDRAKAAEHYRAFADMWKDADPELQPRVRRAREKAEALGPPTD